MEAELWVLTLGEKRQGSSVTTGQQCPEGRDRDKKWLLTQTWKNQGTIKE